MHSSYFKGFEKGIFSNVNPSNVDSLLEGIVFPEDNTAIIYTDRFRDMLENNALRKDFLSNISQGILLKTEWTEKDRMGLTASIFVIGKALTDIIYSKVPFSRGAAEQLREVLEISSRISGEIRTALETNLIGILPETTLNITNPVSIAARKGQEKYYAVVEDFLVKGKYYGKIMNLSRYLGFLRKKAEVQQNSKWTRPDGYTLEYSLLDALIDEYYLSKYGNVDCYKRPFFEIDFFHYLCSNWPAKKKFGARLMVTKGFKAYTPFPVLFGYYIRDDIDDAEKLINDFESHAYERSENVSSLLHDVEFSEVLIALLEKKNISITSEKSPALPSGRKDVLYQDSSWPPVLKEKYEIMLADEERVLEDKILKEKLSNLREEGYFELTRNFAYINITNNSVIGSDAETSATIFYNPASDLFALSTRENRFNLVRESNTRDYVSETGSGSPVMKIHKIYLNDRIFIKAEPTENATETQEEEIDYYRKPTGAGILDEFDDENDDLSDGGELPDEFEEDSSGDLNDESAEDNSDEDPEDIMDSADEFEDDAEYLAQETAQIVENKRDEDRESNDMLIQSDDADRIMADLLEDGSPTEDGAEETVLFPRIVDISRFLEMELEPAKAIFKGPLKINEQQGFTIEGNSFAVIATLADRPGVYKITLEGEGPGSAQEFSLDENDPVHYAVTRIIEIKKDLFAYITCSTSSDDPSVLLSLTVTQY